MVDLKMLPVLYRLIWEHVLKLSDRCATFEQIRQEFGLGMTIDAQNICRAIVGWGLGRIERDIFIAYESRRE